ncbi:MAG: aldo/keto reductase [Eubacterium sp.]|nr:aldo/keto reductase [Eubacterium sp.]
MQFRRDRYGNPVSVLGFGCMRFPTKMGRIDQKEVEREISLAIRGGINYFDTAYIYPGSEASLGKALAALDARDKVKIATKLPHYMIRSSEMMEKYFQEQLRRLQTDHVDYYLMHMLTDVGTWDRLCELGIREWIAAKKEEGSLRQIGFSYHGNADMFMKLLDAYDWDFCQIQYNYLDEHSQAGRTGLQYAASKGIPVVIMEPLRGGKLVNRLPKKAKEMFDSHPSGRTPAEWSFGWLWDQKEVTCVLSGMNSMEMVRENIKNAGKYPSGTYTEEDREFLEEIVREINRGMKVGCTGCRYCMPCPQNVDIPGTFSAYNRRYSDGKIPALTEYFMCTALRKDATSASNCIECGKCERHCPQGIPIRQELKKASACLEGPVYKVGSRIVKLFMKY